MRIHVPTLFGSTVSLLGAFAVGVVLHGVFVENTLDPTGPAAVLGTLGGVVLLLLGRRLERAFEPGEYVLGGEEDEEDEYDEELLPIDEGMLEGREADESYRGE